MLHDITMLLTYYLHILHHLHAMKLLFLNLFLICMFKDANLAEKLPNLAENIFKGSSGCSVVQCSSGK